MLLLSMPLAAKFANVRQRLFDGYSTTLPKSI